MRHAAAGRAWRDAARYVVASVAIARLLKTTERDDLGAMMEHMPVDAEGVAPALVLSALALRHGHIKTADQHMGVVRERLAGSDVQDDAVRLCFALMTMLHAGAVADTESLLRATEAVESMLDEMEKRGRSPEASAHAALLAARAQLDFLSGHWDDASTRLTRMAADQRRAGDWRANADTMGRMALIAAWRGLNRKAIHLASEAQTNLAEHGGTRTSLPLAAEIALSWVCMETYDIVRAKAHITSAEEQIGANTDAVLRGSLMLVRARLAHAMGERARARSLLDDFGRTNRDVPKWFTDQTDVEAAAMDLHDHRPDRAVGLAIDAPPLVRDAAEVVRAHGLLLRDGAVDATQPFPAPGLLDRNKEALPTHVQGFILAALRNLRMGYEDAAAEALDRALCLAATENLRRPFREAPPEVRRLLRSRDDLGVRHGWLAHGGSALRCRSTALSRPLVRRPPGAAQSQRSPVIIAPLTDKEKEVLANLDRLLTTDEIAAEMFITVNTVRTHVRNILRKLGVRRRNQAIRRARELGILPPHETQ